MEVEGFEWVELGGRIIEDYEEEVEPILEQVEERKETVEVEKACKSRKKSGLFQCFHCEYNTSQKISLKRHLSSKHSQTRHHCHCGKVYKWEVDLRRHQEAAHSDQTFPCPEPECDYFGDSRRNLSVHKKIKHEGVRRNIFKQRSTCQECGKEFSSQSVLQRHVTEKHRHREAKVECEICEKTFSRKSSLTRHLKASHGS